MAASTIKKRGSAMSAPSAGTASRRIERFSVSGGLVVTSESLGRTPDTGGNGAVPSPHRDAALILCA